MDKKHSSILPSKKVNKSVLKIAAKNVADKTAEIRSKVKAKQQGGKINPAKKQSVSKNALSSNRLKLLITIVNRSKAEFYLDLLQSFEVNLQCVLIGQGTADQTMLGLLGLTDGDKAVILSVVQEQKLPEALSTLENKFNTIKGGKGVAWTIPLTSVIGVLIYGFLSNNRETVKEKDNGK